MKGARWEQAARATMVSKPHNLTACNIVGLAECDLWRDIRDGPSSNAVVISF
jgi:hypothetical protein